MKKNILFIASGLLLLCTANGQASLITGNFTAVVTVRNGDISGFANPTLQAGDILTGSYGYDSSIIAGGDGTVSFGNAPALANINNFFTINGISGFTFGIGDHSWSITLDPTGIPVSGAGFAGVFIMSGGDYGFHYADDVSSFPIPRGSIDIAITRDAPDGGTSLVFFGLSFSGLIIFRRFNRNPVLRIPREEYHMRRGYNNVINKTMKLKATIAAIILGVVTGIHANIISVNITGVVTARTGSTPFTSLQVGNTATGTFTYDSALVSGPDVNGNFSISGSDPHASLLVNDVVGFGGLGHGALYNLTFTPGGIPISLSAGTTGPVYAFGANSIFNFANDSGASSGLLTISFAPSSAPDAGTSMALMGMALSGLAGFRRFCR